MNDRLLKRRNRASIELRKSSELNKSSEAKQNQNKQKASSIAQKPHRNMSLAHESSSYAHNPE
jgi:hypothetical protein